MNVLEFIKNDWKELKELESWTNYKIQFIRECLIKELEKCEFIDEFSGFVNDVENIEYTKFLNWVLEDETVIYCLNNNKKVLKLLES